MKKIIVLMLVAMSVSMAKMSISTDYIGEMPLENNVECKFTDRSSLKMIKSIPGPEGVLWSCETTTGYISRYEVAFDIKLTYIVVAVDLIPSFGVFRETLVMAKGVYHHYVDDGEDGKYYMLFNVIKPKSSRGKLSPNDIQRAYEAILSKFKITVE